MFKTNLKPNSKISKIVTICAISLIVAGSCVGVAAMSKNSPASTNQPAPAVAHSGKNDGAAADKAPASAAIPSGTTAQTSSTPKKSPATSTASVASPTPGPAGQTPSPAPTPAPAPKPAPSFRFVFRDADAYKQVIEVFNGSFYKPVGQLVIPFDIVYDAGFVKADYRQPGCRFIAAPPAEVSTNVTCNLSQKEADTGWVVVQYSDKSITGNYVVEGVYPIGDTTRTDTYAFYVP